MYNIHTYDLKSEIKQTDFFLLDISECGNACIRIFKNIKPINALRLRLKEFIFRSLIIRFSKDFDKLYIQFVGMHHYVKQSADKEFCETLLPTVKDVKLKIGKFISKLEDIDYFKNKDFKEKSTTLYLSVSRLERELKRKLAPERSNNKPSNIADLLSNHSINDVSIELCNN